jgi:hypothetical protein
MCAAANPTPHRSHHDTPAARPAAATPASTAWSASPRSRASSSRQPPCRASRVSQALRTTAPAAQHHTRCAIPSTRNLHLGPATCSLPADGAAAWCLHVASDVHAGPALESSHCRCCHVMLPRHMLPQVAVTVAVAATTSSVLPTCGPHMPARDCLHVARHCHLPACPELPPAPPPPPATCPQLRRSLSPTPSGHTTTSARALR